jgi:hypothetical protein
MRAKTTTVRQDASAPQSGADINNKGDNLLQDADRIEANKIAHQNPDHDPIEFICPDEYLRETRANRHGHESATWG